MFLRSKSKEKEKQLINSIRERYSKNILHNPGMTSEGEDLDAITEVPDEGVDNPPNYPLSPEIQNVPLYPPLPQPSSPLITIDEWPKNTGEPQAGGGEASPEKINRLEYMVNELHTKLKNLTSWGQPAGFKRPEQSLHNSPVLPTQTTPHSMPHSTLENHNFSFTTPREPSGTAPNIQVNMELLSQQATLALNSVSTFSGTRDDKRKFGDFKREIANILELYVPQSSIMSVEQHSALWALCLKTRLTGEALNYTCNLDKGIITNFNKILESLQIRFGTVQNISSIRNELQGLQQGDLTVVALADKISKLVKQLIKADDHLINCSAEHKQTVEETLKRQHFHMSLRREIFEELAKQSQLGSFEKMVEQALIIEKNIQMIQARNEGVRATRSARILPIESNPDSTNPTQPRVPTTFRPRFRQYPRDRNFMNRPFRPRFDPRFAPQQPFPPRPYFPPRPCYFPPRGIRR